MCLYKNKREREGESTGEKGRKDRCKDRRRVGGRKERKNVLIKKSLFPKYDSTTQL